MRDRHKWKGARRARAVLVFDEFFSGFRAKFQKIVTCAAFSINFAKTNQNFAENSEFKFVKIIHYYSKLVTGVLMRYSSLTENSAADKRGRPHQMILKSQSRGWREKEREFREDSTEFSS